ncbi:hypothetical protein Aspvir_006085 [Aspergillus viridinutans]|uniref:Uncharacterized protein n=1 Tax=Aspergillus viridinutans TaxID=75553 RepID=A0A9P3BYH7_ASPVI|nr:uncharacterized protein Aspvir_006085 [Aspergillus viridinutans]GIK02042.1 hypothetical protein Aspvir_006085 [Aspergillus viridinutans]
MPEFTKDTEATPEKIQPWKAHWPQSTMSTAHLDPRKFARAAGGSKGASPNKDSFVDGTKDRQAGLSTLIAIVIAYWTCGPGRWQVHEDTMI